MIKRIVCSFVAVMVLTSSVFAWDAYSFTGVYDISSASGPVLYASSVDTKNSLDFTSGVASSLLANATGYGAAGLPGYEVWSKFSAGRVTLSPVYENYSGHYTYTGRGTLHYDMSAWSGPPYLVSLDYLSFSVTFSIPVPSNTYGFEADFSFLNFSCKQESPDWSANNLPILELYFDETLVDSWQVQSGLVLADNVYYSFPSKNIPSEVRIVIQCPVFSTSAGLPDTQYADIGNIDVKYYVFWRNDSYFDYYWLSVDEILQGHIDDAQDDINSHESIESEWTGSMTSNFDALDMDNFTFPSGLVSGFGLITGIFQDLWNAMGEYKILFVFPLTLGVALLLIGRISKFSGGQSSSRSNRGDDGA